MADHVEDTPGDVRAAARLREYWLHGEGAAKIRWGEPGDGSRCIALLDPYMPGRSAGYCQNLHERAVHEPMGHGPGEQALHRATSGA